LGGFQRPDFLTPFLIVLSDTARVVVSALAIQVQVPSYHPQSLSPTTGREEERVDKVVDDADSWRLLPASTVSPLFQVNWFLLTLGERFGVGSFVEWGGQHESKGGAFSWLAVHEDVTLVFTHNLLGNGQA
jgi:hypothetical protein